MDEPRNLFSPAGSAEIRERAQPVTATVPAIPHRATLYALASGAPPAGVAVVRVSGPVVERVLRVVAGGLPQPRVATLRLLRAPGSGEPIDRGLVLFFPGPASFTGEDTAEFHLHGGRAIIGKLFEALAAVGGCRPAEAGEFTRRAFENGKLDLTQVEGLADLVRAETELQRRVALRQAEGSSRSRYEEWARTLLHCRALLEAELDFSEEDATEGAWAAVRPLLEKLVVDARAALAGWGSAEPVRSGLEVVVLGAPNAGKSSLVNALARRDAAIVSPEAGTTRDALEVRLDLEGLPVTVVDTAGLRPDASGAVEREGMRRARARAAAADLVLWLWDDPAMARPDVPDGPEVWTVRTKADLGGTATGGLCVSVVTGDGLAVLEGRIADFASNRFAGAEESVIMRPRQRAVVEELATLLTPLARETAPAPEIAAETLRSAGDVLGRLTGRTGVEDVLDVIFREFCIGK